WRAGKVLLNPCGGETSADRLAMNSTAAQHESACGRMPLLYQARCWEEIKTFDPVLEGLNYCFGLVKIKVVEPIPGREIQNVTDSLSSALPAVQVQRI